MTLEEAHQIKEHLNEIIIERPNQNLAPDFINELKVIFNSDEENFSEIDQVEQVLSLLKIYAFPINKKDVTNLYEGFSEVLEESITAITFLDPITEREISLNNIQNCDEEELKLRNILDSIYPSFENEFDSFSSNDNPRKNTPKP